MTNFMYVFRTLGNSNEKSDFSEMFTHKKSKKKKKRNNVFCHHEKTFCPLKSICIGHFHSFGCIFVNNIFFHLKRGALAKQLSL